MQPRRRPEGWNQHEPLSPDHILLPIRLRLIYATALCLAALAAAPAAADHDPDPGTPARLAQHLANYGTSQGRTIDLVTNPAYQQRVFPRIADFLAGRDPTFARVTVDPFLDDWDPDHGRRRGFTFRNRYGATLAGHTFVSDSSRGRGRLPAVILIPGFGVYEQVYWGMAQGLADSGYVVVSVDPQGQGQSDVDPRPLERYCDPDGRWRTPQEIGLRERGECAGYYPQGEGAVLSPEGIATLLRGPTSAFDGGAGFAEDLRAARDLYRQIRTNAVFAAFDTVEWMLSKRSPVRRLIDRKRIGVVGHSLGANGALLAANGDPERRFRAAVAWDGYGPLKPARPRVPTMFQSQDFEQIGPFTGEVDPELLVSSQQFDAFAHAGVESMVVPLRGSTHFEWAYITERQLNPVTAPSGNASRYGERVALYYTRAWLDRQLRPGGRRLTAGDRRRVRNAGRRLLACTYDDSVDRFSTGAGAFDFQTERNVPYRIAGLTTDQQVAYRFRSAWSLRGARGEDLRHGCGERPRLP